MKPFLSALLLSAAATLAGCQQTPPANESPQAPAAAPQPPTAGKTEAEARTLVAAYVKTLPTPELYVTDSARVNDNGATWQVLVPRRDWARRMPNSARFEVQKETGAVSTAPVK
ncbi:hypothetical protein [Hymenobacter armeniacus]|uniref:Lipoprotein n=1 Tax=Hymenobacter armeniacus TaxID=2771358 RepID=A0ABR8JTM0_9BACT|nr:hypothetical protein [Hymenobacter armeniacus]MBD2722667.1 hypothetical protein [Hymenobacter armeniacus]